MFIQLSRGKGEYVYIALSQIISVEGNENRTKIRACKKFCVNAIC
jgi:hypothetical protein